MFETVLPRFVIGDIVVLTERSKNEMSDKLQELVDQQGKIKIIAVEDVPQHWRKDALHTQFVKVSVVINGCEMAYVALEERYVNLVYGPDYQRIRNTPAGTLRSFRINRSSGRFSFL